MKTIVFKALVFNVLLAVLACQTGTDSGKIKIGEREYNGIYQGEYLNRVAFPIGGIGAGMFCFEGTGAISHMSVRNRPDIFNEPCMFAAISVKGIENGAKVLEGPVPEWKKFGESGSGNGASGTSYGLPRFENAGFQARFPFGEIHLKDSDIPLEISLAGWSPFIPTDADNSSLPVGAIEYTFKNNGNKKVESVFSYNSKNFMIPARKEGSINQINNGFVLSCNWPENGPQENGDFAIFTDDPETVVDYCWFRGGWFDSMTMAWKTIENGEMKSNPPVQKNAPGASLFVPVNLDPGESKTVRLMMAWYVPETSLRIGNDPEKAEEACADVDCSCNQPFYKPWYSGKFKSINEVVNYWRTCYGELRDKSELFKNTFYNSTLPPEVLEAVAANLTILKSPTVLRQTDGKLWNFEGCSDENGCCHGSCTHVWNYAQAIPHLFPALERSLRETEFFISQNKEGHQTFRSSLPIRPVAHDFYAASDGQLGGIVKVYREWRISGDNKWLKKMYPQVKASLDYCIETWDPRHKGVLEEPHHNTYDIEFWGPDGMCTSIYLGALEALVEMGDFLQQDVTLYSELLGKGKKFTEDELFNGEYFIQKIQFEGLNAKDPVELSRTSWSSDYSKEALALLQKEGPKYQYGNGCLSDGVLGCWLAEVCGLPGPMDEAKVTSHLNSVYTYNLKHNLTDHVNPQRPSFALGTDGGLLLCTWPKGGQLTLPFVYSNEVWTGIEYQVASHLMYMGEVEKGLDIVRTCRDRYDGQVRNPFNEYECGHWYARAMSSYALMDGITGVRYDAVDHVLYINSKVGDFTGFLSTETGFGNVGLKDGKPFINVAYGQIDVKKAMVAGKELEML